VRNYLSTLIEIKVPDIGDVSDAEIIEIPVSIGDSIEVEDTLIVLETDKATMDVPSPSSGVITKIMCNLGDKVAQDSMILMLEEVSTAETPIPQVNEETLGREPSVSKEPSVNKEPSATSEVEKKSEPPVPDYPALHEVTRKGLVYASPAIRRYARELGADLGSVTGTGTKGRILKEDVRQFIKYELSRPKANANTNAYNMPEMPKIDFGKFGDTESVPLSRIQKVSSVNLHRNWMTIPHVTQQDEADITEMDAFRKSMKEEAVAEGVRLTPLAFMMKAVVASLKAYPRFNASLAYYKR